METTHSGTGVFYQAMPAIGADGKRIMKLIPVQMVNGQFVPMQTSKPKATRTSAKPPGMQPLDVAPQPPVGPSAMQQCSSMEASSVNALSKQVDSSHVSLLAQQQHHQQQPQAASVLSTVLPKPVLATSCGQSVQLPSQLPVIVKSPALPKGQYLQIPPNAQIWTVPASELSQGIKKQILSSQQSSASSPGALNVVFVSPVTTMNPGVNPPGESIGDSVRQLPKTSVGAKPHLQLIPKVSHRPNSPTRWVVEEVGHSAAVNVKPSHSFSGTSNIPQTDRQGGAVGEEISLQSSSAEGPTLTSRWALEGQDVDARTSKILGVLTGRERVGAENEAVKDVPPPSRQEQENTLLMCNGKVFFVPKKNRLFQGTGAANGSEFHQAMAVASSPPSMEVAAPKSRVVQRSLCEVEEVIDLCDEEDEDNVIFVSYSPPKPQSGSVSLSIPLVQGQAKERAASRGSKQRRDPDCSLSGPLGGSAGSHHVGSNNEPDVVVVDAETESLEDQNIRQMESPGDQIIRHTESLVDQNIRQAESPGNQNIRHMESPRDQNNIRNTKSPVDQNSRQTDSLVDQNNVRQTESPRDQIIKDTERQMESPGDQIIRNMERFVDQKIRQMESPGDQNSSRQAESCQNNRTLESSPLTDRRLRQLHGLTADVRVLLQRIDEAAPGWIPASPPLAQEPGVQGSDGEDRRRQQEDDLSPVSPSQTSACLSPQSFRHRKPQCDRRSEAASAAPRRRRRFGDVAVQPDARLMGRTRKRTRCKCCSPEENSGTAEPSGKKGARSPRPAGDQQLCRRHSGPATRSSKDLKQGVCVRTAKGPAHEKLLRSAVS